MSKLLTVQEAAERLGLKPATVRKMLWRDELQRIHPTGRRAVRIAEVEVERIVAGGAVRPRDEDIEALIRVGYRPTAPKPASRARGRVGDGRA